MMNIKHTVGNRKYWMVDYEQWLLPGEKIIYPTIVSSSTDLTVDTVAPLLGHRVSFYLNGGVVGETATLTVTVTTSKGETKIDTLNVLVTAP